MTSKQYLQVLKTFFSRQTQDYISNVENRLSKIYDNLDVILLGNGRSAELAFLNALNLPTGSKVAVLGFTCNASINPIVWAGLDPVFIDIDKDTLNMSLVDLKKKWTPDIKAVIVQNTFGNLQGNDQIVEFAKENSAYVLVDSAHALGILPKWDFDALLFSFGIEKTLPTRLGGGLVFKNAKLYSGIRANKGDFDRLSRIEELTWIANPVLWMLLRRLGKLSTSVANAFSRFGLLNIGFTTQELRAGKPKKMPFLLPNSLAHVVDLELDNLRLINNWRIKISRIYKERLEGIKKVSLFKGEGNTVWLRFPVLVENEDIRNSMLKFLRGRGFYIGMWYYPNIYPAGTDLKLISYQVGSCPVAEKISKRILNLPTGRFVSEELANEIISSFKEFYINEK